MSRSRVRSCAPFRCRQGVNTGSVLVLALWAISLLSAFSVIIGYTVRQKVTVAYRLDERQKIAALSDAAFKQASAVIMKLPERSYDALNDAWSVNPEKFRDMTFPEGVVSVLYDVLDPSTGEHSVRYGLEDEARKLNINSAEPAVLQRFFVLALEFDEPEAQELAAAIIDWRDADSEVSLPGGGTESMYYHGLTYPYEAKNAPFDRIEEILLVKGMSPEIYSKVRDMLTVHGSGKINVNTAPEVVLRAVGLPADITEAVLLIRRGHDGVEGTADDGIFEDPSSIVPKISQNRSLTPEELSAVSQVAGEQLATSSEYFTAHAYAGLLGKKAAQQAYCVIDRLGKAIMWGES